MGVSGKKLNYYICLIRAVDRLPQPVPTQSHLPALLSNYCSFIPPPSPSPLGEEGVGKGTKKPSGGSTLLMMISGIDHHIYICRLYKSIKFF